MDKIIERIIEKNNIGIDKKHKINLCNKIVPIDLLESIENGITIEQLEKTEFDICIYNTQITIHGIFPDKQYNRISGYKYIFQNKNKSIGCKYNAIDIKKKNKIIEYLSKDRDDSKFYAIHNSQEFYFVKTSEYATDKEKLLEYYDSYKKQAVSINSKLFYGNIQVFLYQSPYYGYFIALEIHINAIYENNVDTLIENITNKTLVNIDAEYNKKKELEKIESEKKEKQRAYIRDKITKYIDILKNNLAKNYISQEKPLEGIYIKATYNIYPIKIGYIKRQIKKNMIANSKIYHNIAECLNHQFNDYDFRKIKKTLVLKNTFMEAK